MQKHKLHFDAARAAGVYDGNLKRVIHALKYERKKAVVPVLSDILFSFLTSGNVNAFSGANTDEREDACLFPELKNLDAVTYVPMDNRKKRSRGFNQSELLARGISERANIPVIHKLQKIKATQAQVDLSEKERWENVNGVFEFTNTGGTDIQNKRILLIDDVLTTGATASACSRILRKNGAEKIFVATLANTP